MERLELKFTYGKETKKSLAMRLTAAGMSPLAASIYRKSAWEIHRRGGSGSLLKRIGNSNGQRFY